MVFASFTNLSVASVASKAFTILVQSFLSGSNDVCRELVALVKAVLELFTPVMLPCAFVRKVFSEGI